jgi:chloramphenicol-sensitive protein RarD
VPPLEILAHRIAWSLVFLAVLLTATKRWSWLGGALRNRRVLAACALSAAVLSLNWFLYIWSVNSGHVVEASLGYFINPLVNVTLGRLVLKERLRPVQQVAIAFAFAGVAWLTWSLGAPPWVSLTLAASFGVYGLLRKGAPLDSLEGLTLETLLMAGPAVGYLVWLEFTNAGQYGHSSTLTTAMLSAAGVVTALPLLAFAAAARRLPLSVLGVLQFISPSLQLVFGIVVFHEALTLNKLIGFGFIWLALVTFSAEGLWRARRRPT